MPHAKIMDYTIVGQYIESIKVSSQSSTTKVLRQKLYMRTPTIIGLIKMMVTCFYKPFATLSFGQCSGETGIQ
jgi:hypothetical protein